MSWNNWIYADRLGEEKQTTKPQTNADRIRTMSDEELAAMFTEICHGLEFCDSCPAANNCPGESAALWLRWLKQPAEVE